VQNASSEMKTKSIYLLMFLILKTNSGQLEGNLSSNVCWKEGFFRWGIINFVYHLRNMQHFFAFPEIHSIAKSFIDVLMWLTVVVNSPFFILIVQLELLSMNFSKLATFLGILNHAEIQVLILIVLNLAWK